MNMNALDADRTTGRAWPVATATGYVRMPCECLKSDSNPTVSEPVLRTLTWVPPEPHPSTANRTKLMGDICSATTLSTHTFYPVPSCSRPPSDRTPEARAQLLDKCRSALIGVLEQERCGNMGSPHAWQRYGATWTAL